MGGDVSPSHTESQPWKVETCSLSAPWLLSLPAGSSTEHLQPQVVSQASGKGPSSKIYGDCIGDDSVFDLDKVSKSFGTHRFSYL